MKTQLSDDPRSHQNKLKKQLTITLDEKGNKILNKDQKLILSTYKAMIDQ